MEKTQTKHKGIKILTVFIALLLIAGCKKAETPPQSPAEPAAALPASESGIDSIISNIKEGISNATESVKEAASEQPSQTVFVPVPSVSSNEVVSVNYVAPCMLQKYKGLSLYCKGKNVWHNYSTVTSWYIPYTLVLLLLIIAAIILWLRRNR